MSLDASLRARAAKVIPGGMYGHLNAALHGDRYPQFFVRAEGARQWDADGREYVDLMCSWGPMIVGHRNPRVEAAAAAQQAEGDCLNGPGPVMVELAELLVDLIPSADWAMFSKNGTDATTQALMVARAATGRTKALVAHGAYHGATPGARPACPESPPTSGRTRSSSPTTTSPAPSRRGPGGRRRRRHPGHPVQARLVRGPGARRRGVRPGACGRWPTGSARRWSSTTYAPGGGWTCAARGSRSACAPT
ncbi:aminotransferase class III-fold pyridoxal phosphate-dependent enzyme [Microbispora sp. GKU 823]|uniref:aminotransferase class III-fold pyridoxal phosphate-dependent enzyme n=1 Tax=Microbispora sp. GKU 823 TaxID=1652100 RepID=UPI002117DAC3|nr:aminotransferase class III-fold pyridoxal phosphate-dependent enzyme [Microbispora sp. GKU 823]